MTPERWQKVKETFQAAIQRAPGERSAFLANACRGDETLRQEVESLLASHEKDGSFIDSPAYEAATELLKTDQELEAGQTIGHYEILSTLGRGGMGEVYLARDTKLGRKVALKFLPSDFTKDAERLRRFEQEARAVSALNHPNILTIHEIGAVDGHDFIATEFVDGQTLRGRMTDGGLKIEEALDIAIQITSALAAAHEEGIVHRDIKPDNIMLRRDGLVKVLDFGLAKLTESKDSGPEDPTRAMVKTSTGIVMGTTAYMSPEQARGLSLDARTDIWSFGVVLYEMVTGRAPFTGPTAGDLIAQILEREPPPLSSYKSDAPAELHKILQKALCKDREQRYQTSSELLADLKSLKLALELGAHSRSQAQPWFGTPARNKRLALIGLLSLLLLVPVTFAVYKRISNIRPKSSRLPQPPTVLKTTQITNGSGLDVFAALSPDGNAIAFSSDRSGAFEIHINQLTPGSREIQITSDGGQNLAPAWSPDGKLIAYYSRNRGGIWVVPALGGVAKQLTQFGSRPTWSPDGSSIAFQSVPISNIDSNDRAMPPSVLWLVPAQGGEARQLTKVGNPPGGHGAPAWSPDGKRIAFTVGDFFSSDLTIWSMSTNGSDLKQMAVGAFDPLYSPDGEKIYFAKDYGLWSLPIAPEDGEVVGEPAQLIPATGHGRIRFLTISANGKKLAFSPLTSTSNIWSLPMSTNSDQATGSPVPLTGNADFRTFLPSFSADGSKIAYQTWPTGAVGTNLWLMDADGKNPAQLTTSGGTVPSWLNQERVAFLRRREEGTMLLSVTLNGGNEKALLDFNDKVEYARLSPDGKQVAFNSKKSGTTNVWTISIDGRDAKRLTFDNELMAFPCWSPDGKFLAFQMKRGDDQHVAIIPSGGGTPTQITFDHGLSWSHSWSPDGNKIAFAGSRNGIWNIWWVSRLSKEEKQLTNYTKLNAYVRYPSWSPLANQIVYEYAETTGNIWLMELK
jgi:eukaryotic-like serine/threonine-protein kinase